MIPTGTILAGKYRVERVLGQGGMGIVVQATHLQLHQPVAVKFLLPEVLTNPEVVQRFLREAQAVVRLKSEHVARVIDIGSLDDGAPYMVLEYLDGTDLADFPRQQLTIGQIVDLMLQACEALAEAHAIGIVHRDLKPANFFITQRSDGSRLLKVLDFGISKLQQTALERNLTATATVMGTPAYMSPEQMRSTRDVDNRSDIWALGVVLYELLQGAPPFVAETFGAMAIRVATEPLPPLSVHLPQELAEVVARCLEKDPARRFQNVAELAHVLAPYAQSTAQAAVSVERTSRVLRTDPPRSTSVQRPSSTLRSSAGAIIQTSQLPRSARRPLFIVGSVMTLSAIVVIGLAVLHTGAGAAESDTSSPVALPSLSPPTQFLPDSEIVLASTPLDAVVATAPPDATVAYMPVPVVDAAIGASSAAGPRMVVPLKQPASVSSRGPRPGPLTGQQPPPSGGDPGDILGPRAP
jgi:serine/threonine-protein kinase